MTHLKGNPGKVSRNSVLETLADERRRYVLAVLLDRTSHVAEEDFARHLAAVEHEKPVPEVTDEDVQSFRIDLAHVQLPTLDDAGLIAWDREAETVTTTDHPAFEDSTIERIVETEVDGLDDILTNLAHERRRIVLSVLEARDESMTRADLARAVAARDPDLDADTESVDDLNITLRHVHLPMLADAGLIEYDADDGTVTFSGHRGLNEDWLDQAHNAPSSILTTAD